MNTPQGLDLMNSRLALSRETEFKVPEEWVGSGSSHQLPGGAPGRVLSIRIGVDFGTAYTKVAIRVADKVFFVPWSGTRRSAAPYLLPAELTQLTDGSLWLGRAPSATHVHSGLKLPFLGELEVLDEHRAAAAAFLALVLRYARAWLYRNHASLLRGRRLAWQVNVGCPTNSWTSSEPKRTYQNISAHAWQLSLTRDPLIWNDVCEQVQSDPAPLDEVGLDGLYVMPEFIAQIAGYVRSPQRKNGLHMIMDVGAGTVDLATFNIVRDAARADDCFPIFASGVLPFGTHFLMAGRFRKLGIAGREWDDLQAIPENRELANVLGIDPQILVMADQEFGRQLRNEIGRIVHFTRSRRYGKAREWQDGLPVFISGGGAGCEIYRNALAKSCMNCNVPYRPTGFPLLNEAIAGSVIDARDFHRLSVAYGLTHDAESVGRILSPQQIDDAPRFDPLVDVRRERPDRDELYPK